MVVSLLRASRLADAVVLSIRRRESCQVPSSSITPPTTRFFSRVLLLLLLSSLSRELAFGSIYFEASEDLQLRITDAGCRAQPGVEEKSPDLQTKLQQKSQRPSDSLVSRSWDQVWH